LQHGDSARLRRNFDGRFSQLSPTAGGSIRLRDDGDDFVMTMGETLERRHRELRRAHENQTERFATQRFR
jgi:hypothetical protein